MLAIPRYFFYFWNCLCFTQMFHMPATRWGAPPAPVAPVAPTGCQLPPEGVPEGVLGDIKKPRRQGIPTGFPVGGGKRGKWGRPCWHGICIYIPGGLHPQYIPQISIRQAPHPTYFYIFYIFLSLFIPTPIFLLTFPGKLDKPPTQNHNGDINYCNSHEIHHEPPPPEQEEAGTKPQAP